MKVSSPNTMTVIASVILASLGVLLHENVVSFASLQPHDFWLVTAGFAVLFLGVVLRGL
jgi:hypothetical protein